MGKKTKNCSYLGGYFTSYLLSQLFVTHLGVALLCCKCLRNVVILSEINIISQGRCAHTTECYVTEWQPSTVQSIIQTSRANVSSSQKLNSLACKYYLDIYIPYFMKYSLSSLNLSLSFSLSISLYIYLSIFLSIYQLNNAKVKLKLK